MTGEKIGIVVIGKNEGARLSACFQSINEEPVPIVYVDSASTDNSIEVAKQFQIHIVQLSEKDNLSAALGRNKGAERLFEIAPDVSYIQFVDGDTTLNTGWLTKAEGFFKDSPRAAIVAGKLKERDSLTSSYKKLSELEWETHGAEIPDCGGNFMVRADVFRDTGGFNSSIVAGEDTEFCYRVRQKGWRIFLTPLLMGMHDSSVQGFSDFWRRAMRTGYAYQQISGLHGMANEKLFVRENKSNWVFGGIIPLVAFVLIPFTKGLSLLLLLAYPLLMAKIYIRMRRKWSAKFAFLYAWFCVVGKFPGFLGACKFLIAKKENVQ